MKQRDKLALIFLGIISLVAVVIRVYNYFYIPEGFVLVNSRMVKVLLAETPDRQFRGLGGKKDLGEFEGMYFLYGLEGKLGVVMRDMNFPIDVVWLKDDVVVEIKQGLLPEPNKNESNYTAHINILPADAFLELRAGGVQRLNIRPGDKLVYCKEAESCGR